MGNGSSHRMWLSKVHTCVKPYVSAFVPRSTTRALGGVVCNTTPMSMRSPLPVAVRSASDDRVVGIRPAVPVERPAVAHRADLVQVQVAHDQLRLVRVAHLAHELSLGVDEVALPVEVVVAQWLDADTVDCADVVHVRRRGRRLLEAPDV